MPKKSRAFLAFCESLDAPNDRRYGDDLDLGALGALRRQERKEAEDLLLDRLASDPADNRLAPALASLGCRRAVLPLRNALAAAQGPGVARMAQALATLDPSFDASPHYLAALSDRDPSTRGLAAGALAGRTEPGIINALLGALRDDSFAVRASVFGALIDSLGLGPLKEPPFSRLREIGTTLLSDLPSVAREAAGEMQRIADGLRSQESPQALGLTGSLTACEEEVARFMATLQDDTDTDRDFEGLEQLAGDGRRFVESMLVFELPHDDPRVPRALARIGTARAIAALEDASRLSLERSAGDVANALRALRAGPAGG